MSLEERKKAFIQSLAKNLVQAKRPTYAVYYYRLVITRRATELILSSLLIFSGQQFLLQNSFFSPIWTAVGVALSAVFLRGYFLLYGIFLGVLLSYLYNHVPWHLSLAQSLLFTLYIFLTRLIAVHTIGAVIPLAQTRVLWKFFGLVTLFSTVHAYTLLLVFAAPRGMAPTFFDWSVAWLGEVNGILYLTPLCLIFEPFVPKRYFNLKSKSWWICSAAIIISHFLYYIVPSGAPSIFLALVFICILSTYANYFDQIPTCITLLGISVVYISGILTPPHLFHIHSSALNAQSLFALFTFNAILPLSIATYRQQQRIA